MTWWAQGKEDRHGYLIASECAYFAKLALAIALHEVDEAVLDRQRAEWIEDLRAMLRAQAPPKSSTPILPPGLLPPGRSSVHTSDAGATAAMPSPG